MVDFLHGRYIETVRQLLETEHFTKSGKTGLVFIAYFENTFDEVQLECIYKSLEYFKCVEYLIQLVSYV
jgi:hypothetical protein